MLYPNLQKKIGFCDFFEKLKKNKVEKSTFRKISNKKSEELEKSEMFLLFVC
jgi:hypothetical protein